jgi:hypothetical protein
MKRRTNSNRPASSPFRSDRSGDRPRELTNAQLLEKTVPGITLMNDIDGCSTLFEVVMRILYSRRASSDDCGLIMQVYAMERGLEFGDSGTFHRSGSSIYELKRDGVVIASYSSSGS